MRQYLTNLKLWLTGWSKFDELLFDEGWSGDQWRWRGLYLFDHGSRCLLGGAVVTWSRWFHDNRERYGWANFCDRLLNHVEHHHGKNSGPILWGSKDTEAAHIVPLMLVMALLWWWLH